MRVFVALHREASRCEALGCNPAPANTRQAGGAPFSESARASTPRDPRRTGVRSSGTDFSRAGNSEIWHPQPNQMMKTKFEFGEPDDRQAEPSRCFLEDKLEMPIWHFKI